MGEVETHLSLGPVPSNGVRVRWLTARGRDPALRRLLATGDAVAIVLGLAFALAVAPLGGGLGPRLLWGLLAMPLVVLVFKLYGLYDRDVKRISHSTVDELPSLAHAIAVAVLLLWVYARYTPMRRMDLLEVVLFGAATSVLVVCARFCARRSALRLLGSERALVVGGGAQAQALVAKLAAHPEYRLDVIGTLGQAALAQLPVLGERGQLAEVVKRHGIKRVLLASGEIDEPELEELLRDCRAHSLKVSVLPKLYDMLGPAVEVDDVGGIAVLGVNPPWLTRSSRAIKRGMDIVLAASLLVALLPLLVAVAVAIKLDSRGPVLFRQERIGRGGRRFCLLKFRSMVADAECLRAKLLAQSSDPNWLMIERDPRITRIGRWLRRLSIDELPQLWNVLRGQMSMVGPRPLIPAEDDRVQGWARGRLDLTPGITGYWQVLGRTRIPFAEMVKLDYLYVMNWSLWEDVRLMLRTLPAVLGGRGAN